MKHLKWFDRFINESYGEKMRFYHVSEKEHLSSLLKSIDIKRSLERGQGSGFYVLTDLSYAEKINITGGFGMPFMKKCDLLIEIEAVLNEDNFDLDYELIKELPKLVEKVSSKLNNITKLEISGKDIKFHVFFNKSDKLDESDFIIEWVEIEGMGVLVPKCNKDIPFGFYPDDLTKYQDAQNVPYTTYYMDSLDSIGIKSLIEKELYNKIGKGDGSYALRYVGVPIKPTRYKIKDDKGHWGDWIENK